MFSVVLIDNLVLIMIGIVVLMLIHGTSAMQRFEQQPSYTEVNPGQDALLFCKVHNKRGSCSWQKDNKPMGMYPHKYEWASGTQDSGDCSIWIRAAQLEFDDGNWECQVTASDFHTQDALTSLPIRLVVRVPPQRPRIEHNGTQVLPGHNLTALHGEVATIKCVSHYGNPPPVLKWFLDQHEIVPSRQQTNTTELDNPRTWLALSTLELTISKENHGRTLRCVAVHESYPTKSSSIEVRLDVMYAPETRIVGLPTEDVEDLKDSVAIRCHVSANPRASVVWKREGQSQPASLQELLQFSPIIRAHSGLYSCIAMNKAGQSEPRQVHVDVKFPPKIVSIGPDRVKNVKLFSSAAFECMAEGNPLPTYQWYQKLPGSSSTIVERSKGSKLFIANVTYDFQGEYRCQVTNVIKGDARTIISDPIILHVHGAPQVLRHTTTPEIYIDKGKTADLSMVVCADPRPRIVAWEWGSLRLEAGSEMGRYKVDEVTQEQREDCYQTTLHIRDASSADSRAYYLAVENDRGTDRHAVQLYVSEPLQMGTLVGLAGGLLVAFIILVCGLVYAVRTEKCCFARKGDFKPADLDGHKPDIEKTATGPGGIPADAIYTTTNPRGHRLATSPDAMKPPMTHTTFNGRSSYLEAKENHYGAIDAPPYPAKLKKHDASPSFYESDTELTLCPARESDKYLSYNKYVEKNPYFDGTEKTYSGCTKYHPTSFLGNKSSNQKHYEVPNRSNFYGTNSISKNFLESTDKYLENWSYNTMEVDPPRSSGSSRKTLKNKYNKNAKARPKPLQYENEKYYDLVFPKYDKSTEYYQQDSLENTEL